MPFRTTRRATLKHRLLLARAVLAACATLAATCSLAQTPGTHPSSEGAAQRRARAFTRGRTDISVHQPVQGATALAAARAQHLRMAAYPEAASLTIPWTAVGPVQVQTNTYGLITGRITAAAIDPADTTGNTVYLGTSGGGVWKSTNAAGVTSSVQFKPLTDALSAFSFSAGTSAIPSLSVGAVSVQPGGTGVILAGTGDPNDAADSYYGSGLLRSADNGLTWSLIQYAPDAGGLHSFIGEGFAGFAWSTASPQLVVAAVSSSAESNIVGDDQSPSVRGLYYSADGGNTWSLATIQDGSTVVQSQSTDFTSFRGNAATAVVWNPVRKRFYAAIRFHGYYESTDGITWTRLATQPGTGLSSTNCPTRPGTYGAQSCPFFRGALAAQPTSGDLFALTIDAANNDEGLWQDTCALSGSACTSSNVTWATQIDATPMETAGVIPQGDYNLTLAAVPAATALSTSDTLLFAGTADLYRCSLSGGCTLRNTTNTSNGCAAPAGVAPAQHAIALQANLSNPSAPLLYIGNDGGLWRSIDGVHQTSTHCSADDATHFNNLNGGLGSLGEVSSLSSHPSDATVLLAALGANGSAASTTSAQSTDQSPWTQLSAAESGTVAIDPFNGSSWLAQSGAGVAFHTCPNGAACTSTDFAGPASVGLAQTGNDTSLVDPPALFDPALNINLILGSCRVWRGPTSGGSAWSGANAISPFLSGPTTAACTSADGFIRSLAAGGAVQLTNASQTSGSPVLYAGLSGAADGGGTAGGHIFSTNVANLASSSSPWTDLTNGTVTNDLAGFNPGGFDISSIAVDPNDTTGRTVYATILGFGYPHVYRSTNAGATWTNISANLPNAPANAVTVDPNDARIVYVAMDTGVYVTTDVNSCITVSGATVNCWSVMGTALPNAPVLSLVASKSIAVPGSSATGVLRAGTFGRGIWQQPLLTAGSASQPVASFSPTSLSFAAQSVGTTSATQTATLTNTGSTAMAITTVRAGIGFQEADTCTNTTVAAGSNCTITVSFKPVVTGPTFGSVQVAANVTGGFGTLPLTGTGTSTDTFVLTPTSVDFGSQNTGTTSNPVNITISNTGVATGAIDSINASGDFIVKANTCGASLAPQTGCTVSIVFAPSATGVRTGLLTVVDDAGTQLATFTGTGTAAATDTLSPLSLTFATQQVNTASATQTVTLTNSGDTPLTLVSTQILAGDFNAVNNCGPTLTAHNSCGITVSFVPKGIGALTGTLQVSDVLHIQTVALAGTAIAGPGVSLLPSSLVFAHTGVGVATAGQTLTLTNNGGIPLQLSAINLTGDFGILSGTNTCSIVAPMAVGSSCSFQIAFLPTAAGLRSGTVSVLSNGSTQIAQLAGTGVDFALVADGSTSFTIATGANAVYTLLMRPAMNTVDPVTYACTGAPANATCKIVAQYNDLSATGTVTVTVLTGATAASRVASVVLLLPVLLGLSWSSCKHRLRGLLAIALAVALMGTVSCGSSRVTANLGNGSGGGGTAPVTPSGTDTITVSATAAGVTHSLPLTLTVQ